MRQTIERHFRLSEVSEQTGYSVATLRKMLDRRQLGYRKINRIISIPESEVERLLGEYHPPVLSAASAE